MTMLLSFTTTYSQSDTEILNDTLVYTPAYLMQALMSDLEQCDLDRIELKKAKAELALLYIDYAKQSGTIENLRSNLKVVREERDTLEAQNMQMAIDNTKALKKVKRSRNGWFITTIMATMSAVGIHYNWKESWIK
jgi:septal ring factor EnvC (AmiA/AmiB activator)